MGLARLDEDRHPTWQRWKCRAFGPHGWVPVERLIPNIGALIEEGASLYHEAGHYWQDVTKNLPEKLYSEPYNVHGNFGFDPKTLCAAIGD